MKKIHVTLRRKALKSGRISLYLDFSPAVTDPKTGETYRREFLKLYLMPKPKNAIKKTQIQKIYVGLNLFVRTDLMS